MTFKSGVINDTNALPVNDQGAANIVSGCVAVSNVPVLIVPERMGRKAVLLSREGDIPLFIGNETVSASNAYKVFSIYSTIAQIETSAAIYGTIGGDSSKSIFISYLELF
jgi:hypothetical protein